MEFNETQEKKSLSSHLHVMFVDAVDPKLQASELQKEGK